MTNLSAFLERSMVLACQRKKYSQNEMHFDIFGSDIPDLVSKKSKR